MSNYGKIDILWYDVSWPLPDAETWESVRMNTMARALQPHIWNNRSKLDEDFGRRRSTSPRLRWVEAWEACMTFNGAWGYMPISQDWRSAREVLDMLQTAAAGQGSLLLNIGPTPDGSVPPEGDRAALTAVGEWIARNGDASTARSIVPASGRVEWLPTGRWTLKGHDAYFWCTRWPGREIVLGGIRTKVNAVVPGRRHADRLRADREPPDPQEPALPRSRPCHRCDGDQAVL